MGPKIVELLSSSGAEAGFDAVERRDGSAGLAARLAAPGRKDPRPAAGTGQLEIGEVGVIRGPDIAGLVTCQLAKDGALQFLAEPVEGSHEHGARVAVRQRS